MVELTVDIDLSIYTNDKKIINIDYQTVLTDFFQNFYQFFVCG